MFIVSKILTSNMKFYPVGLLAAPGGLIVIRVGNTLNVSWDPPFSLKDINFYTVYVRGMQPAESQKEFNVTETHFILNIEDLLGNHKYIFQVSAHNLVGEGNMSGPVEYDGKLVSVLLIIIMHFKTKF